MNFCSSLMFGLSAAIWLVTPVVDCSAQEKQGDLTGKRTVVHDRIGFSIYDFSDRDDERKIPVLYFHGTSSSKREPDLLLATIREKKRLLISFDRPGYGDSAIHSFGNLQDYDQWAEKHLFPAIHQVLDFEPRQYDFVSVSGGALFALRTVHAMPYKVRKISLLSAGLFARPAGGEGYYEWARKLAANRPHVAELIVKVGNRRPKLARAMTVKNFSEPDKKFADCHRDLARKLYLDATRCGAAGIVQDAKLQLCDTSYAKPLPKGIQGEIWKGACDNTISLASSKLLAEKTGIELHVIHNEGHLSSLPVAFEKSVISHGIKNPSAAKTRKN